MAKVFISHRIADISSAERLAEALQSEGHTVWLDAWEIKVGDSIVGRMQEGISGAGYLVLCLSEEGVLSPWISREWMSALARQLGGFRIRLLPCRLTGGQPPALIADLKY